jgi:hypothetical protein
MSMSIGDKESSQKREREVKHMKYMQLGYVRPNGDWYVNRICMELDGIWYDVGTRIKYRECTFYCLQEIKTGTVTKCDGNVIYVKPDGFSDREDKISKFSNLTVIYEVVEPVYYEFAKHSKVSGGRDCPEPWEAEIPWIWYIVIMVVGAIFKDRWLIWIFASLVFLGWRLGFLRGGKK